jgi:hypothetical protein
MLEITEENSDFYTGQAGWGETGSFGGDATLDETEPESNDSHGSRQVERVSKEAPNITSEKVSQNMLAFAGLFKNTAGKVLINWERISWFIMDQKRCFGEQRPHV